MLKILSTKPYFQLKHLLLKNKTKTYVLLIAVLGVWGLVGFKIVSAVNPEPSENLKEDLVVKFNPKENIETDTFSIQIASRDPFLGTLKAKRQKRPKILKKKGPVTNLPIVTYSGVIKKQQSSQQVFVVNINNEQYLLKKGQIVNDVKLIRGGLEKIVVRFNGTTQTILIQ